MLPDDDACYAAVVSRDSRFDGRIFVGVLSTGIYCRPVCPARTPQRRNVRFFATAGAASAAGLRACRRCRPDSLPGSREWDHRTDLVARALRLIGSGQVDQLGVAGLAARLAVSERHLRRCLIAEVGASPQQLARTRRAQTARMLVEQTGLTLTDVAFASGFASLRQFNDVMKTEFGVPPSQLRRRTAVRDGRESDGSRIVLRLSYRKPYDVDSTVAWLVRHAIGGLDSPTGAGVATSFDDGDRVECEFLPESVHVTLAINDLHRLPERVSAVRAWLDLDAQPEAVDDVLRRQDRLRSLVDSRPGLRVVGSPEPFRAAALAVLGQQVTAAAASTLARRLCELTTGGTTFPTAMRVAGLDPDEVGRSIRLPRTRARALVGLAAAVASGDVPLGPDADREATTAAVLRIRGVGPWTASDIRMRALRDPDVWPEADLVLRRMVGTGGAAAGLDPRSCRPWRSYAAHHVWHAYGAALAAPAHRRSPTIDKTKE